MCARVGHLDVTSLVMQKMIFTVQNVMSVELCRLCHQEVIRTQEIRRYMVGGISPSSQKKNKKTVMKFF